MLIFVLHISLISGSTTMDTLYIGEMSFGRRKGKTSFADWCALLLVIAAEYSNGVRVSERQWRYDGFLGFKTVFYFINQP